MRSSLLAFLLLFSAQSFGLVDMRNGNYSENFTDLQVSTAGFELKILRAYNSRTLYNGIFGFGWCSELGTVLKVNPDDSFRITECGAGAEAEYRRDNGDENSRNKMIAQIMNEVRKRNTGRDADYFKNIEFQIKRDSTLRDEFAKQLNLKGQIQPGVKYLAEGRINDTIEMRGTEYIRTLPGGTYQKFDKDGKLIQMSDRSGNFIRLTYQGPRLTRITDNKGSSLNLQYAPNSKHVQRVTGPAGLKAEYKYKGELLVSVKNGWGNTFTYEYDDLYNLTKVSYPDKSFVALTYNKEKDWVTSFRDRKGCVEKYVYVDGSSDPLNNYRSDVTKTCGGKITNKSTFEFWHRVRPDGTRYLAKTRAVRNGDVAETEYHPIFGRPILVTQSGISTRFDYYDNGLMKLRADAGRTFTYKYDDVCKKVSEVTVVASNATTIAKPAKNSNRRPSKAETRAVKTQFTYDKRTCYPTVARNSEGQVATLSYDFQGRVNRILDQSKKEVRITYDDRFGKASVIERPGLGRIRFVYKANGEIAKVESDESPLVVEQIAGVFRQFLEMIAPATTDTTI